MSSNKSIMAPQAREAMNQFKMEAANDLGVKTHIKIITYKPQIT